MLIDVNIENTHLKSIIIRGSSCRLHVYKEKNCDICTYYIGCNTFCDCNISSIYAKATEIKLNGLLEREFLARIRNLRSRPTLPPQTVNNSNH